MREAWIETKISSAHIQLVLGRLPCGRRGLKHAVTSIAAIAASSPPVREAWIET